MSGWLVCACSAVGTRETTTPRRSATALRGSRGMRRRRGTAGNPRTLLPARPVPEPVPEVSRALAQLARGDAADDRVGLDVAGHDGAGGDDGAFADRDAAEDRRADRDPYPVADHDRLIDGVEVRVVDQV